MRFFEFGVINGRGRRRESAGEGVCSTIHFSDRDCEEHISSARSLLALKTPWREAPRCGRRQETRSMHGGALRGAGARIASPPSPCCPSAPSIPLTRGTTTDLAVTLAPVSWKERPQRDGHLCFCRRGRICLCCCGAAVLLFPVRPLTSGQARHRLALLADVHERAT